MPLVFDGSDQLTGDFGLYDEPGLPQLEHTSVRELAMRPIRRHADSEFVAG